MKKTDSAVRPRSSGWRKREGNMAFHVFNYIFLSIVFLVVAYPLYFVLIASISSPSAIGTGSVILFPKELTMEGFKALMENDQILTGYKNSLIYTVVGVIFSVSTTLLAAYSLSRKELPGRKYFMLLIIFTMYFGGGMIPSYLLVKDLGLLDTIWALVLPTMIVPYNLIIAKTFFETSIPKELWESAVLDGCTEYTYFRNIVLPVSGAIIAILVLFYGVSQWNTYFNAMIYIRDQLKYPLQLVLRNILIENQVAVDMVGDGAVAALKMERASLIKYVSIIVSAMPLLVVYPFVQKHFVKGVLIGAVKG